MCCRLSQGPEQKRACWPSEQADRTTEGVLDGRLGCECRSSPPGNMAVKALALTGLLVLACMASASAESIQLDEHDGELPCLDMIGLFAATVH